MADDLALHMEAFWDLLDLSCRCEVGHVELHPMSHIERLVHLLPLRSWFFLDQFEEGRYWKQRILDDMDVFDEFHDFGLASAAAMDDTVDMFSTDSMYHLLDDGCICPGRGEYQFPYILSSLIGMVSEIFQGYVIRYAVMSSID